MNTGADARPGSSGGMPRQPIRHPRESNRPSALMLGNVHFPVSFWTKGRIRPCLDSKDDCLYNEHMILDKIFQPEETL